VLRQLLDRIRASRTKRAVEEYGMSPAEKAIAEESPEDQRADLASLERLGGGDGSGEDPDRPPAV